MLLIDENGITLLAKYLIGILRDMKVLITILIFTFHENIFIIIINFQIIYFLAAKALYNIVFFDVFENRMTVPAHRFQLFSIYH